MNSGKHYSVSVQWSDEDEGFVATAIEFEHLSGIGPTPGNALEELNWAIDAACESLLADRLPLPPAVTRPSHSGNLRVRVSRSLHRQLAERAALEGVSLNQLASTYLAQGVASGAARVAVEFTDARQTPDLKCFPGRQA